MKPLPGKFELTANSLVRSSQLLPAVIPVSKATFQRMRKAGKFPPPCNPKERIPLWLGSVVIDWLNKEYPKDANEAV